MWSVGVCLHIIIVIIVHWILCHDTPFFNSISNSGKCLVRFVLGRLPIRAMHYAVDNIDLNTIFPNGSSSLAMENPSAFKKCKADLKNSDLNQLQTNAVIYMLKHSSANVSYHMYSATSIIQSSFIRIVDYPD